VMSHGKLQQVATPQEIYNKPVNGFVASFVGENNILNGKLIDTSGNTAKYQTELGTFDVTLGPKVGATTPSRFYLRPEHSRLVNAAEAGANSVPVEVTDVAFEGNFISIQSRGANGQTLVMEARNDSRTTIPAPGEKLHFAFDAENAVILADETVRTEGGQA
jgi:spermidine/putrescine transport system ATP-binding protein